MKKLTRSQVLDLLAFAGYHQDSASFTRLYIENRVSYVAAKAAYRAGTQQKARGIGCTCIDCKRAAERDTLLGPEVAS